MQTEMLFNHRGILINNDGLPPSPHNRYNCRPTGATIKLFLSTVAQITSEMRSENTNNDRIKRSLRSRRG